MVGYFGSYKVAPPLPLLSRCPPIEVIVSPSIEPFLTENLILTFEEPVPLLLPVCNYCFCCCEIATLCRASRSRYRLLVDCLGWLWGTIRLASDQDYLKKLGFSLGASWISCLESGACTMLPVEGFNIYCSSKGCCCTAASSPSLPFFLITTTGFVSRRS